MKTLLLKLLIRGPMVYFLLTAISLAGFGQSESNNPITYDTTISEKANGEGPFTWQVRVTRQQNDNSPRPVIFSMPGAGEVGTDVANLVKFGPHYWLLNGWDGGVKLGNGTHYPIIITVEQPANNMRPWHLKAVIETLLNTFPIKRNSVHVAGLSQGSYEWGELIGFAASAGDETAMSEIKSWVDLEGVGPGDNFLGFDPPYPTAYKTWASKYGGKFFGLEGTIDSRNIWQISQAMNAGKAGSAYFSYQNIGGGAHCCWNSMYDPSVTNWQDVGTITNANIVPSTNPASTMGTYFVDPTTGTNIFQWMLRQGDTTLVTSGSTIPSVPLPTVSAGSTQSVQLPASSVTLTGTASAASGHSLTSTVWTKTSGPASYVITTAGSLSTTVTGLAAGTYVFTLTATDDAGQTNTSTVTITVLALQPPTVNAGSTLAITLPVSLVNLSGTATGNGGATISTTKWTSSGPNTPLIVSVGSLATLVTGLVQGSYTFTLTATDNNGNSASSPVTVTVSPIVTAPPPTTGPKVIVAPGEYQVFFIDQNKHLYGVGTNLRTLGVNQTGVPGTTIALTVPSNLTFTSAAAGLHGGAAIDNNGNVWSWGDNSQGQVGNGTVTTTEVMSPVQVSTDASGNTFTGITSLCAYFAGNVSNGWYAIKSDGTLWVWGQTLGGMAGDGTAGVSTQTRPKQVPIPGGRKAAQVIAGDHLNLLCTDGTVWVCGGYGANSANLGFTVSGTNYQSLQQLAGLSGITQVAGGSTFNYALKSDGTLYGWGYYGYYMGGTGGVNTPMPTPTDLTTRLNLPHPVKSIVNDMVCTHVILTDGTLWGWGDNAQGGIGNGHELDYMTTTAPYAWDFYPADLLQQAPVQITTRNDFVAIFATQPFVMYTYAETSDGQLYSWGRNKGGVLGNGVISCSSDVTATYPNSWDVPLATAVNPLAITKTTVVPSPWCLSHATTSPCNECSVGIIPIANAGPNATITLPVSTASVDGSASNNPGGGTLTYAWAWVSGPSQYTITSPTAATTTITNLVQGVYSFQLTVTNSAGVSATSTVTVTVNAAPVITPVANAGADVAITLPVTTATVDGSASSNPGGGTLTYAWTRISGPTTYTITSPSAATTTITNLVQGVYQFQLLVTNSQGKTATDVVSVTVNNAAAVTPVANAGSNIAITLPVNSVNLDGSASSDPAGNTLTYAWTLLTGPAQYSITSPSAAKTSVTNLVQGVYKFSLLVTNSQGNSATATVYVTVNAAPVVIPVASVGTNISITLPVNSATLDGSASYNPGGGTLTYAWTEISGPATYTITSPSAATTTVTGLVKGIYQFQLLVTNSQGNTAVATISVTVIGTNLPPIANAGNDTTINLPINSLLLNGSKSYDPDGSIVTYSWYKISGPNSSVAIVNSNTATPSVIGLVAGTYVFELKVTDNQGLTATDDVTITVMPGQSGGSYLVASAGNDTTIALLPANSITLNGSGSTDVGGTITSYGWTQVSGPSTATLTSPDVAVTLASNLEIGQYIFQLTVKDDQGNTATAVITVNVVNDLRFTGDQVMIYPNPAQNQVHLRITSDNTGTMRVNIYNELGAIVQASEIDKGQAYIDQTLDVSRLARGMYIVQIVIGDKKRLNTKLIKQ